MAKYITLDGLSTFLGKLKDGSYRATGTNFGAIKVVGSRTSAITTVGTSSTSGRSYGIELDSNGKAFVNVPWKDTTYKFGTGLVTDGDTIVNCDNKTLFAGRNANGYAGSNTDYNSLPLQLGQDYSWQNTGNNLSNLNNFVEYGVYNIFGEHTRSDDNLPIMNIGGGHTFQGRLLVYDSSLPNTGNSGDDCCITQVLTLSNRVGGDGNTYIRTGVGSTKSNLTWETWGKLQTNVEVGQIPETNLANLIDNGIYSGVISYGSGSSLTTSSDPAITFVLITVNGYAAAAQAEVPACCTQLLYGISVGGTIVVKKRKGVKNGNVFSFEPWGDLGGSGGISEIPVASATTRGGITLGDSKINPFYIIGTDTLRLCCDNSLGTTMASGTDQCMLVVKKASSNNIGGIKTGYTPTLRNYQVQVDTSGNAYTEVGTATVNSFGVVKAAAARSAAYSYSTGGTTSNRYYGVEIDTNGKLFVNVPWTASSTATASTTALTVTYKTLSSGGAEIKPLSKDTITRISTSTTDALSAVTGTITISSFEGKNSDKITTYGLQFKVGTSGSPKLIVPSSVKWANGIEPILTGDEIIDIVFTTTDGTNYLGTWTKYY